MKNKILFINPPQSCSANLKHNSLKFPLGFLYMGGILEKNGFEVKILDCPVHYRKRTKVNNKTVKIGLFPEDIEKVIREFQPDIIGLSCAYTAYESDSFELIELIKRINDKILIIVGGAHASANPEYVLRNKNIDITVIGEGEETILEIANKYPKKSLNEIKGIGFRDKNKIKVNPRRERIKNLDENKAAWHLIDMNLYFKHPDNSIATMRSPSVDIITSRGCPGNCVFCSIRTVWGRVWYGRSAKNIADELEFLNKKYKVKQFRIFDDNMTLDKKRTIDLCNEIIERKLDIRWDTPNGVAFWTLDEEVLKKMKKAGCYRITFGIESCSLITQKYIKKDVDLKKINNLINLCHKIGIWICASLIIGFPYETLEEIKKTKDYIINSRLNFVFLYIAQPYQGTDLYDDFKKENLIPEFKNESNVIRSKYNTKYLTNEKLNELRASILKRFQTNRIIYYLNPWIFYKDFLSKIRNFEDLKY
ncbi:B12-binding domain-containing radical SAM protein, partial [Candidatus Pacearchaeota archaeon]|nr:B12-binding domain-containing radical SAM protein [Candidatus Pacearchaeota archaeon]